MNDNWLPHLTNEMIVGARNNNLCSYLIGLEGWRRGLTLTWYSQKVKKKGIHAPGRMFSLSNGVKTHVFYKAKGDRVDDKAISIGINKERTKAYLCKAGVSVPEGKVFNKNDKESMIGFAEKIGYPVVIKPRRGSQGKGVIANIQDTQTFKKGLVHLIDELKVENIIVEKHIVGEEHRFFVLENKVLAVLRRIPANVIGDGSQTIKELIKQKNDIRRKNPRLYSCLIKIDFELKRILESTSYTLDSIPEKGKRIFLRENSNVSTGGDSIDVTDEMPQEIKDIAIKTLKAIPGLPHAGVDIMVNNTTLEAAVLEINPIPQIGSLVFPMEGKARDIPSAIVDYYFPETQTKPRVNSNVYFDFRSVLRPLINKTASKVVVEPAPPYEMHAMKYTISGSFEIERHLRRIRKRAVENDLFGFAKNSKQGKIVVVVAGEMEQVKRFEAVCKRGIEVTEIKKESWSKPIKLGFFIKVKKYKNKKKIIPKTTFSMRVKKKIKRIIKR